MSTLRVDTITDEAGTGPVTASNGLNVTGTLAATSVTGDGSALTGITSTPASTVIYVAQNTAPTGYLKANGAAISRTTYADLFAAIGTTFGSGNGSTTFNVPDLRGEFIRAWDDARGIDSGRSFGSAQSTRVNNLETITSASGYDTYNGSITLSDSGATTSRVYTGGGSGNNWSLRFSTNGGDTYPRNIALLACIKY